MYRYLIRRVAQSLLVIFGVMTLTFFALQAGGDPTYLYVSERAMPAEIEAIRHRLVFDQPIYVQYAHYLQQAVQGDFGTSLSARVPAFPLVLERLPATIELTFAAIMISTALAIPLGIVAALNRGRLLDGGTMVLAMLGQSMPSFFLGIVFILIIGVRVKWLPISGYAPILAPLLSGDFAGFISSFPEAIRHLIMPSLTIAVFSLARNARLVRSVMLEALSQDYVRTARSKGLRERRVIVRHALPNALIPLVTLPRYSGRAGLSDRLFVRVRGAQFAD